MRTTVDLDAHLLKRLRAEARRRGVSFKELLTGVVRRGLEEPSVAKQGRYRCQTFSMGTPRTAIDMDKALGLAADLEDEEIVREIALRR